MLNLPHQNRLCTDIKPAFSFWINILTVSEVMCHYQGLGLVARIEASILVFDTMQVLYWPVLRQIQFCSFDRRCETCLDTKPVLYQDRFCSLTYVSALLLSKASQAHVIFSGNHYHCYHCLGTDFLINKMWLVSSTIHRLEYITSRVSCQKGPTRHAYAWQIGPFWQDTLDMCYIL